MAEEFQFDVFLSHNAKDKPSVRKLAERLKAARLRMWFDEWKIRPGEDRGGTSVSDSSILSLASTSNVESSRLAAFEPPS